MAVDSSFSSDTTFARLAGFAANGCHQDRCFLRPMGDAARLTHFIFYKVHLDLSTSKCKCAVEPVFGFLSVFRSLVSNKSEPSLRHEFEIRDDCIFQRRRLSEVCSEGRWRESRGQIEEDKTRPIVSLISSIPEPAYMLSCLSCFQVEDWK